MCIRDRSQALRKLTSSISKSNTAVVFINQVREKVGVFWGSPETTPGGRALKFYSSVRIDLRKTESIKQGTDILGNRVRARVVKNKLAAPFKTAEFDIMFNEGISHEGDLLDLASEQGIIKKSGSFYSFGEIQIGRGREKSKLYLKENPVLTDEISELVKQSLNPDTRDDVIVPASEPIANDFD